ncbi:MAG: hypothetical protein A2166_03060 [Omnitrophica WOR_2 bacterium RBG_13_41_10]|nr:MAG: hypothetical protein A2166_03060 [Omnitrophica WOR_2 bacterium RBG_13_41_10]
MLLEEKDQTMDLINNSIKRAKGELVDARAPELYLESLGISEKEKLLAVSLIGKTKIDPVVNVIIGATSGHLYKDLIGRLESYPIPELRLEGGHGKKLLDIGCNWGRWSAAAYKLGYGVVGIDPSLGAIMAAKRVSNSLNFDIKYVVADARFLPFSNKYFDVVFSYSVLQHLDRRNVELCLKETSRLLKDNGYSFIQLANKFGMRSFYHQLKRGFRESLNFEVRYWTPSEMVAAFNAFIGETSLEVDGYFGLGIQKSDIELMSKFHQIIINVSEALRRMSKIFSPIVYLADSLYVRSMKTLRLYEEVDIE